MLEPLIAHGAREEGALVSVKRGVRGGSVPFITSRYNCWLKSIPDRAVIEPRITLNVPFATGTDGCNSVQSGEPPVGAI
jgi:hypothetical protein